jgi:hypothetical protein
MQRWVNELDWQVLDCTAMLAGNALSSHLLPPDDRRSL